MKVGLWRRSDGSLFFYEENSEIPGHLGLIFVGWTQLSVEVSDQSSMTDWPVRRA